MKTTRYRKHNCSTASLITELCAATGLFTAQAEKITVTNMLGDERIIYDSDGDGWDDLWCAIFRELKHRDKTIDTDGDGITDYDEMLRKQTAEFQRVRNAPMDERLRKALSPEHGLVPVAGKGGQLSVLGTDNLVAADTISIDELWVGGSSPLPDLSGAGRLVGVWEAGGGVLAAHNEFQTGGGSRVIQVDDPQASNLPLSHNHATQVAGTIAAAGFVGASQGGAFAADIDAFDSIADIGEMAIAVSQGLELSNHSYSIVSGWRFLSGLGWTWFGRDVAGEDPRFGIYTELSRQVDLLVYESESYLPVFSSSNEIGDFGPVNANGTITPGTFYWLAIDTNGDGIPDTAVQDNTTHAPDGGNPLPGSASPIPGVLPPLGVGFDTVKRRACAKNNLAVGAISDVVSGIQDATDAQMAYFSSHGPTDDGRIKPDLVANGTDIVTTDFDANNAGLTNRYTDGVNGANPVSGTSYSTPSVTGAVALIQELNQTLGGSPLWASSLKAVMLHTAEDAIDLPNFTGLGTVNLVGPDYFYGWGVANAESAATLIRDNHSSQSGRTYLRQHVLFDGNTIDIPVQWDGSSGEMRFTIAWTDPAFQSIAVASSEEGVPVIDNATPVDDPTLRLINDLDLRILAPGGGTLQPWRLDPANPATPATTGDNTRDNVEQVVVAAPVAGTYTVRISHKGSLRIAQAIQPGHPQYDPNTTRYELVAGQYQRVSVALSGNAALPGDRFAITSSAVVYVDLPEPEGFLGIGPGNPFTKTFDFDGNGTTDLEFQAGVDIFGFYVVGAAGASTRVVGVSGFGVVPMVYGESIGSILGPTANPRASLFPSDQAWFELTGYSQLSHIFNDGGNVTGGPWHPENDAAYGEDAYLGFEFQGDDGTHYGWLRIHEFAGVGGFFREYAYNDTPGENILAGQIPEPSTTVLLIGGFAFVVGRRRRNNQGITRRSRATDGRLCSRSGRAIPDSIEQRPAPAPHLCLCSDVGERCLPIMVRQSFLIFN